MNAIIYHLSSNQRLAHKIAEILNIPVGKTEIRKFLDDEIMVRNLSDARGKDAYIIQSTSRPASDNILEVLILINALKNSGAKTINLVIPYFGYSRQDRIALSGEPVTAKVVADMFQSAGIDKLITVDLHTYQIQGFFSCPVINIETSELFGAYYHKYFESQGINEHDVVVVSPDHGSVLRARDLGSAFKNASLAFIDKRRPAPNQSEVVSVIGDVKDKHCVIVDDIIDTCGTINNAYDALVSMGAKDVYVCATHAVFSVNELNKKIKHIVVTDTIEKDDDSISVITVANLIADAILNK